MRILASLMLGSLVLSAQRCAADAAAPLPSGVYTGAIGGVPVVVQFGGWIDGGADSEGGSSVRGVYFYRKHGVGIAFVARRSPTGIEVFESAPGMSNSVGDSWQIAGDGSTLSGTWHAAKGGASYPIALARVADATRSSVADRSYAGADYVELLRDRLTSKPGGSFGTLDYTKLVDERNDVSTVQFTVAHGFARANAALRADLDARRSAAIDCLTSSRNSGSGEGEYKETVAVSYASPRVVSLDVRTELFCGGAHPDANVAPVTVDVVRGEIVDWSRAIADRTGIAAAYARGAQARLRARDPACASKDVAADVEDYSYAFVRSGLLVHGNLPHVVAACEADVVVPTTQARALLAPAERELLP